MLLGMWINLWVVVPTDHPGAHATHYFTGILQAIVWALAGGTLMLKLHVVLGLLLFLGGAAALVLSVRAAEAPHG